MAAKVILSSEPHSPTFSDRILVLDEETVSVSRAVKVSRANSEEKPETDNAVFDCQVETDKTYCGKEKCIIARLKINFADGTEFPEGAVNNKFIRTKADICGQEQSKQIQFHHQEDNIEDKGDQLENINAQKIGKENEILKETVANLEKKLKRKQNENINLLENIAKFSEGKLHRVPSGKNDTDIQMKKEITELTNLVQKDKEDTKLKEGKYVNLASLINEEMETVHEIQIEMKRLLNIIAEDQETILKKDQTIMELENSTQYEENATKVDNLQIELDHLKNTINEKEEEIKQMKTSLETQEAIFETNKSLEAKLKESMCIVEQKNKEIEIMQNGLKNQTDNDSKTKKFNYNNIIMISELKASICQKESKIKRLKESIDKKDKIIVENNTKFENHFEVGIQQLQAELADQKKEFDGIIKEREEMINKLRERIESDQGKSNHIKSEFDNLKNENEEYLKSKDEEIKNLKHEIIKEKQIVAHVQFRKKREIVKKEREMSILNTILTQERRILLEKEEEVEKLRSFSFEENLVVLKSPPTRPPRTKSLVITAAMQEQAGIPTQEQTDVPINKQAYVPTYEQVKHPTNEQGDIPTQADQDNDNSDAVIFHDALNNELSIALSDEEDVLMEDLELDEETDDRKPRRSDINIEDFLSGQ